MGWKSSFKMGKTYGADDLNEITKTFVSGGAADTFENGLPYNLTKINDVIKGVATSGAVPETVSALKVSIANGKVKINAGRAVMNDGSICIVDSSGVLLDYTQNAVNYVYILNDTAVNDNVPMCTTAEPTGTSDFVMLAKIDENGVVTDKRQYAKGKNAAQSSNLMGMTFYTELEPFGRIAIKGDRTTIVCNDITGYNHAVVKWVSDYPNNDTNILCFVNLNQNGTVGYARGDYRFLDIQLYIKVEDNKLMLLERIYNESNYPSPYPNMPVIKIWLF